jgi:hypothetical protein
VRPPPFHHHIQIHTHIYICINITQTVGGATVGRVVMGPTASYVQSSRPERESMASSCGVVVVVVEGCVSVNMYVFERV